MLFPEPPSKALAALVACLSSGHAVHFVILRGRRIGVGPEAARASGISAQQIAEFQHAEAIEGLRQTEVSK